MEGDLLNNFYLLILITIALVAAWYSGYSTQRKKHQSNGRNITQDYFVGLNYLLNDEPDDAIDIFISALSLNSNTLETYIALGTLLRRRGKVDRSIIVYQDLLAWTELTGDELDQVKIELVRSYIAAGLLDRAEGLLEELDSASPRIKILAFIEGITVYQLEKDWLKAIQVCSKLLKICPNKQKKFYQKQSSHFFCELSEIEMREQHFTNAREALKSSFQMDKNNVRASLLLGELEIQLGNFKLAIKALEKVKEQDQQFVSETFPLLLTSFQNVGLEKKIQKYINESFEFYDSPKILLSIASFIEEKEGGNAALDFLLVKLKEKPSLRLLNKSLLLLSENEGVNKETLVLFHRILTQYIETKALYKCNSCGFQLKSLHWLCPSCSVWGDVKPEYVISRDDNYKKPLK